MATETVVIQVKIDAANSAKTIEELTKRNAELAKLLKQAPREGTEEFKKLSTEIQAAKNEFAKNREEIQKFNRSLRETEVAADSLKGLSRQLRELEDEYKRLGKAAREGAGGAQLQKQIRQVRDELKAQEKALGDARRNVGNYSESFSGLQSNLSKFARLQQRTLGAVRFLAVGMFQSFVDGAKVAYQALDDFSAIISSNYALNRRLSESVSEVAGEFVAEKAELEKLVQAADKSNGATKESIEARKELIERYGESLTQQEREAVLLGDITAARREGTKALIENLAVEAQRSQLKKIIEEIAQAEADQIRIQQEGTSGIVAYADAAVSGLATIFTGGTNKLVEYITDTEGSITAARAAISEQNQAALVEQAKDIDKIGLGVADALVEINNALEASGVNLADIAESNSEEVDKAAKKQAKSVSFLSGSLADLNSRLAEVNKAINETVRAGDAEGFAPLVAQAENLNAQIKATEESIQAIRNQIQGIEAGSFVLLREEVSKIRAEFEKIAVGTEASIQKLNELIAAEARLAEAEKAIKDARETDAEREERIRKELEAIREKNEAEIEEARRLVQQVSDEILSNTILRLSEERNLKLSAENLTAEQRLQIEREYQDAVVQATIKAENEKLNILTEDSAEFIKIKQNVLNLELDIIQKRLEAEAEANAKSLEETKKTEEQRLRLKEEAERAAFQVAETAANLIFDIANNKAENEKEKELQRVRDEYAEKLALAAGNAQQEQALKEEQARKEREIEKKAAQQKKSLAIAQAVINGALGALQTIANLGFPLAIPALIAVAAVTAANIATIASQKFARGGIAKFEDGGIAPGRLHRDGGTPAVIGGREPVEIEVGEAIVNRKSTARYTQTLSDINQAEGGIRFPGTARLTSERRRRLDMFSNTYPIAERGLLASFSPSVVRRFQTGGVSSVASTSARVGQQVEFTGRILTEDDVRLIAKAAAEGTKAGIESANLYSQFKRQNERQIDQNNRSKI